MNFSLIQVVAPRQFSGSVERFCEDMSTVLPPFSQSSLQFVDSISRALLRNPDFKQYPEMIALGYWLRKSNITRLCQEVKSEDGIRLARGLVFHVAPSNVDTIFIYSLIISLLMGNKNLVRVSAKSSVQKDFIMLVLNEVLESFRDSDLSDNLLVVTYPHDESVSRYFSQVADARMLWGGDHTVGFFTGLPIRPTAIDIKFANKYSLTIISPESVEAATPEQLDKLARLFVNDSYSFTQQACSSPRSVCWVGTSTCTDHVKGKFWSAVQNQVQQFNHELNDAHFSDKLTYMYQHAAEYGSVVSPYSAGALLTVIDTSVSKIIDTSTHSGGGVFLQCQIDRLTDLNSQLNRSVQTLTYFGFNKHQLNKWVSAGVAGIDRVVPVGQGLDFDYIWDGVNLFDNVSRIISVK